MRKPADLKTIAVFLSIIAVAVITYLPVIDNFFISDDFGMLTYVQVLRHAPLTILQAPSEFFRLTSYLYFSACMWAFGAHPAGFYWSGIGLHAVVSLLVYMLVFMATRNRMAGWSAALFFAAYERHQEAVMWISAANDTLVTLFCLLFLILWLRQTWWARKLALIILVAALFSKEQAVSLAPLVIVLSLLNGKPWSAALREASAVLIITIGYICLWLSYSGSNAFVTNHYYAFGLHFFPVYARAWTRLLSVTLPFVVALYLVKRQFIRELWERDRSSILFFATIVALSLIPVSFLTYQNSIPSRNTYYPSVGLSAIVGLLCMTWHQNISFRKSKYLAVGFLSIVMAWNIGYVWLKKEPQYVARAASTRQLIDILNNLAPRLGNEKLVCIEGFPLDPWTGTEAARWFTAVPATNVSFSNTCNVTPEDVVLRWNDTPAPSYIRDGNPGRSAKAAPGL